LCVAFLPVVVETLKDTVPVGQFSVWIKPLKAQEKNGTLTILAPNDSAVLISVT
jgi:chromosomal replication initiator protein